MTQSTTSPDMSQGGEGDDSTQESSPTSTTQSAEHNKALAAMRKQLAARERELEQLKANQMSEQEKAISAAKAEGAEAYRQKWASAMAQNAALNALSAKGVTAPELALGAMDLSDVQVDPHTGRVDTSTLDEKVAEVIRRYPMLTHHGGQQQQQQSFPFASGSDQRRVTQADLASATGKNGDTQSTDELLRWALGGKRPQS